MTEAALIPGFLRNAATQVAGRLVAAGAQALTLIIATRILGPSLYGRFALVVTLRTILVVPLDWSLILYVGRAVSQGADLSLHRLALTARLGLSVACAAVAVGVSFAVSRSAEVHAAALVMALGFVPTAYSFVLQTHAQSRSVFVGVSVGGAIGGLVTLAAAVLALALGGGLLALSASLTCGAVASAVASARLTPAPLPPLRPSRDVAAVRRMVVAAAPLAVATGLVPIYGSIDVVLLSGLSTPHEVGIYDAAYRFVQLGIMLVSVVVVTAFGPAATAAARTESHDFARLAERLLGLGVTASAIPVLALSVAPGELLRLVYGHSYVSGAAALRILGPALSLMILSSVVGPLLITLGRDRATLWLGAGATVTNVTVNLALIPRLGATGSAWATVATEVVVIVPAALLLRRAAGVGLPLRLLAHRAAVLAASTAAMAGTPGPYPARLLAGMAVFAAGVMVSRPGALNLIVPAGRR